MRSIARVCSTVLLTSAGLFTGPGRDAMDGGPGRDVCNGGKKLDTARRCESASCTPDPRTRQWWCECSPDRFADSPDGESRRRESLLNS